jgi:uncharacterized membrane protein YeaQ/YmgE (transglycosylase-associated protein family)
MGVPLENVINSYIWLAVGGVIGWVVGLMMKSEGRTLLIENVLVSMFGAFIGGDFVVALLNKGIVNDKDFSIRSLAFAVVGAIVMLLILKMMRRVVGPMRAGKSKVRDRS